MLTKQHILDEIKRTTQENSGKPLGVGRFEKETGIKPYDWGRYWARYGDAQREAGIAPNQLQSAYPDEFIYEKAIILIRKLGKFPTYKEFRLERIDNTDFPDPSVFQRLGSKQEFARKIVEYSRNKSGYEDVVVLCEAIFENSKDKEDNDDSNLSQEFGEVYLFKSGRYYKIGKTKNTVRRGSELRIQLPEKMDLIHSIKTDDPSGIEVYWHKRFESKRMNGEWFDLDSFDIKAFKRWRRIH